MPSGQPGETSASIEPYDQLLQRFQYRDALVSAQAAFGPYKDWLTPGLRLHAIRCLHHLNKSRSAHALTWTLMRSGYSAPQFIPIQLQHLTGFRGELAAWDASKQFDESAYEPPVAANLLCERAHLAAKFRDFQSAEELLDAARKLDDNRRVAYHQINLLYLQDDYSGALKQALRLLDTEPDYRPAVQITAHLFQLLGQPDEAVTALHAPGFRMQSFPVMHQLFGMYLEAGEYALAEQCVDRAETLLIDDEPLSVRVINRMRSDLLCDQQRYEEAMPYLELVSPFHDKIHRSIRQKRKSTNDSSLRRKVLDVPFVSQKYMTCAPASIAAVTQYLGAPVDQDVIANDITYDGTPSFEERRWLANRGWIPVEFEMTYASVKSLIDAGYPILLATVEPGAAHLQVLAGYDENLDTLILRDPNSPRLQEMLARESIEYYAADGPRCLILANEHQLDELADLALPARDLYDLTYRFNQALETHDRDTALQMIERMQASAADHRLTLQARRMLALYDRDEVQVLQMTEALLQQHPQNVNLQRSKIESLSYLDSEVRKMEYLEHLVEQADCHFQIKSRMAEELRFDDRQLDRAEKLLKKLLAVNSLYASSLYAYAGLLWGKREYYRSYEIYRFLTCLEDKNEGYAESYFKAARYCQETDKALAFLADRVARFGDKSSGPAISLFNALDSIHRTADGLKVLESAMTALPADGELLIFAAREHTSIGNLETAETLMARAEPLVKRTRYLELAAHIRETQQDRDAAIECLREIVAVESLNFNAADNLVRLLQETGDDSAAGEFIENQLALYPHNFRYLRLKTDWADHQDVETRINAYQALLAVHPDQGWAYLGLARIYLEQLDTERALKFAMEAMQRNAGDAQTHCVTGQVYRAAGRLDEASTAFRRAIELSCDMTEAYQPLVDLALDNESQAEALRFIYRQLLEQVTFGEALLAFQRIARDWLSADELLRILKEANNARPDLIHSWLALAIELRSRDQLDASLATLNTAIERFPLIPRLKFEKAKIFRLLGDLTETEALLESVLELSPGWTSAGTMLADLYESQGKFDHAQQTLERLIHASHMEPTPYGYLASLQWRLGHKEQALESIRRAIDISPDYSWAWNSFHQWCTEIGQPDVVVNQLTRLRESMPANAELVITQAKILDNPEQNILALEEFLQRHPQHVEVTVEYIQRLVNQRRFEAALDACSEKRWGQKLPLAMRANHAWIRHVQGYVDDAIAGMESVVETNPNYYDGWRFLSNWYADKGDSEKVCTCIEQCLRIYPNDPSVLCFAAEKYQAHDSDNRTRIEALFKRAFYLDPSDQYIGLSYIDYLLECGHLDAASVALEMLELHASNPYVTDRKLSLACRKRESAQALEHWRYIIGHQDSNDALIQSSWRTLNSNDLMQQAGEIIQQQRDKDVYLAPFTGECFAYYVAGSSGIKALDRVMKSLPASPGEFDNRAIEGYLRTLIHQERDIPKAVLKKLRSPLQADTLNWGLIAYLKTTLGQSGFVAGWMQGHATRQGVEAWMLYFYSMGLRHTGQWEDAVEITRQALELPHDNYFNDLVVWRAFDMSLERDFSVARLLEQIDTDDLAQVNLYVYALTQCLVQLGDRSFTDAYDDLRPYLDQFKAVAHEGYGNRVAWEARKKAYFHVKATIKAPFFQYLVWRSKLGHYFK